MSDTNNQLQYFVDTAKSRGASDESLTALLRQKGWPDTQVYAAIGSYWERVTGFAIPERSAYRESSRDAFLYLLSFSTLAIWATALGAMLFDLINHWLPDPVSPSSGFLRASLNWRMASIAVAFPIYLLVMRTIVRETQTDSERLQSGVRKWLTWLALLLTAGSMIGDVICFLDYFLNGELTLRFVLKCLVVFVIAGSIFWYYLQALRGATDAHPYNLHFAGGATIAVVTALSLGLFIAGTPVAQRRLEADRKRVEDLRRIANVIHFAWMQNRELPGSLEDAALIRRLGTAQTRDPETHVEYEYRLRSGSGFELCAGFNSSSQESGQQSLYSTGFWNHPAGRSCFALDAMQNPPL